MNSKVLRKIIFAPLFIVSYLSSYAQISGTVYNQSSNPVANSLIYKEGNPEIYARTTAAGTFTINATTSDKFRISALGLETKRNYSFASSTNNTLILQKDLLLLAGDDYHISFDHCRPSNSYIETELKADFPVPNGIGFYDGNAGSDRAMIDHTESLDLGGHSLRIKFPKGGLKTAASGVDTRIPLAKTYKDNDYSGEDVYLSYWIKFSDNFEFDKCGGKLPSLGGSDLGLRTNVWKGRIMWRHQGSLQFYMELPHDNDGFEDDSERFWGDKELDAGSICSNEFTSYLKSPGWHNIELHYKLDHGNIGEGTFEGWVDGGIGYKKIDAEVFGFYRPIGGGYDNLTTNAILISAFLGGSSTEYEPLQDTYAWVDEFRVSNKRIDEFAHYNTITDVARKELASKSPLINNASASGNFILSDQHEWQLYTQYGAEIFSGKGNQIDIGHFPKGMYLLRINNQLTKILFY